MVLRLRSNNTNKLSPQEHIFTKFFSFQVQIIQINLVLKNRTIEIMELE